MIKRFFVLLFGLVLICSFSFSSFAAEYNAGHNIPNSTTTIPLEAIVDTEYIKYFVFSPSQFPTTSNPPRLVVVSSIGMPFDVYLTVENGAWYIRNANLQNLGISQELERYVCHL